MGTTITFAEALRQEQPHKGPRCSIGALLAELEPDNAAQLRKALDAPGVQHAQIARALRAIGHNVGPTTISRHRSGECKNCDR